MAAHNSGGVVIVQVERIVDRGTMNTRAAHIPGAIVDKIVLAPAENHWMHLGSHIYDGSLSGEQINLQHNRNLFQQHLESKFSENCSEQFQVHSRNSTAAALSMQHCVYSESIRQG